MKSIAERHNYILEKLREQQFVKVSEMAEELNVTTVTIRKDLKILEERNLLFRTHGSAMPVNPHVPDMSVHIKGKLKNEEKRRIAIAAAKLIQENDSIIISAGSTNYKFAEQIQPIGHLNVVSSSLPVSILLNDLPDVSVIQLGGNLDKKSMSVRGEYASAAFKDLACSKLFLGVDGIDKEHGITNSNIDEALLSKSMIEASSKIIVLADSSKFGKRGFGKVCGLEGVDIIITDDGITDSMANMLDNLGIRVIIA
ncbi:MAG: DeoR/GlpR transcriptional regulator [Bacteroidales bacterium]|nr:DeoR/GlpR transcriptional regulator [Bacteroidales bacterium]